MKRKIKNRRTFVFFKTALMFAALLAPLLFHGCGYRVRSAVGQLPGGAKSIGIPTFRNLTGEPGIEQMLTRAILREFSARTRGRVDSSDAAADLVLLGEVKNVSAVPVTFGAQNSGELTFSSTFQVTVRIGVKLVRQRDSAVVWENESFVFRERCLLNSDVRDFFAEDTPALERLARNFAAALAGTVFSF
ncbi:MAG: LPS assembly lipoprotein LptE [Acidobacteriota bacterium]|nr:LPS assembly lipoprotein LptE [Acidobacteriota bacterium]